MALPTETITLLKNAKLIGPLDCNGQLLDNADPDSFPGGNGNGGNDTGTTTAILKGDGHHGFADAVAGTDYATPGAVASKEDASSHNSDISSINTQITSINTSLTGKADATATTTALAGKEPTLPTTTNDHYLLARRNVANGSAWEFTNPATIAGPNTGTTTAILKGSGSGGFADATAGTDYATPSALSSGLAAKENTLPTTTNDAYVLARHNAAGGGTFFFVDPVTLGSTNASYADGATHGNATFNSNLAAFTSNDTGKTIVSAGNISANTTITFVSANQVTLSSTALTNTSPVTFTILNRYIAAGGGGTVTNVAVTNTNPPTGVADLVGTSVNNPGTSAEIVFSKPNAPGKSFYGNSSSGATQPAFMTQVGAYQALDITTIGKAIAQEPNPTVDSFIKLLATGPTVAQRTGPQVLGDIGGEPALTFNAPLARGASPNQQTVSIPTAASSPSQVTGALSGADHAAFTAKLSSTRKFTTTAPLTITSAPGGTVPVSGTPVDLSDDRVFAMPTASSSVGPPVVQVSGFLTGADHADFKSRVQSTRGITATGPLRISIGSPPVQTSDAFGDFSANRVIDMPPASATQSGYLTNGDFANFNVAAPHIATVTQPGSNNFPVPAPAPPAPPTTRVVFKTINSGPLTVDLNITLPTATNYSQALGYPYLEFVDLVPGGVMASDHKITLTPAAGQTIDGAATFILPRSMGYLRLNSDGGTAWYSAKYYVDSFRDPTTTTKKVVVDVSQQTANAAGTLTLANGASVTVNPLDEATGTARSSPNGKFLTGLSATGVLTAANIYQKDIRSSQDDIVSGNISGGTHIVPIASSIQLTVDNIRLSADLSTIGPITVVLPPTGGYTNGEAMFFYDAAGTISSTNTVTFIATGSDTVNNIVLNRPFDSRRIICNSSPTASWTIESYGGPTGSGLDIGPYLTLTDAVTVNVTCNTSLAEQHWNLKGTSGVGSSRTVNILGARDGERFRINYTHYTTNDTFKIASSATPGAATGPGGLGLLTLSTAGANTLDTVTGTVIANQKVLVDTPSLNLTFAAPPAFNTSADAGPVNTGVTNLAIGSATNVKFRAGQFVAANASGGGANYTTGRVDLNLDVVGTPANLTGLIFVALAEDAVRAGGNDPSAILTAGSNLITNATTVVNADVGQRVTSNTPGAITDPAYIASVTPGVSFTISANKDGTGAKTVNAGTWTGGVSIWGTPGPALGTSAGVAASGIATSFTGTYTIFTGFTPVPITVGKTYWIIAYADTISGTTDFVQWKFQGGNTGHLPRNASTIACGTPGSLNNKPNFTVLR